MFPSTGLFKFTLCPLYPKCHRALCYFSHDSSSLAGTYLKDCPDQAVIKRPLPQSTSTLQEESARLKRKKQPIPTAATFIAKEDTTVMRQTKEHNLPTHKPTLQRPIQPKLSLEPTKRTAHVTNSEIQSTKPPVVLPNIKSKIPIANRQMLTNKLFEIYQRIYAPILSQKPTAASESTIKQEEDILNSTTNLAGYKQKAASVLGSLKKRPTSTGLDDMGIDGEWKDPALIQDDSEILDKANQCLVSLEGLEELKYPLPNLLDATIASFGAHVGNQTTCDRCKNAYVLKDILENADAEACLYHPQRMITLLINGEKKRTYNCCQDAQESNGCTRGPHVYKEDDLHILHSKIPFTLAPPHSPDNKERRKIVALDCEMGYTTAGMELIRLTVVDDKKKKLLDELALPSHMVIDLNTKYSGVKTLEGVKHDLRSLKRELFRYVDQDTIIVGHGLENDMCALRLIHTNIIDTVNVSPIIID
ncbi:unnamed protein product [Rhizopus stolonifer]